MGQELQVNYQGRGQATANVFWTQRREQKVVNIWSPETMDSFAGREEWRRLQALGAKDERMWVKCGVRENQEIESELERSKDGDLHWGPGEWGAWRFSDWVQGCPLPKSFIRDCTPTPVPTSTYPTYSQPYLTYTWRRHQPRIQPPGHKQDQVLNRKLWLVSMHSNLHPVDSLLCWTLLLGSDS